MNTAPIFRPKDVPPREQRLRLLISSAWHYQAVQMDWAELGRWQWPSYMEKGEWDMTSDSQLGWQDCQDQNPIISSSDACYSESLTHSYSAMEARNTLQAPGAAPKSMAATNLPWGARPETWSASSSLLTACSSSWSRIQHTPVFFYVSRQRTLMQLLWSIRAPHTHTHCRALLLR